MTAAQLLSDLADQGITLSPEGDGIRVAPASGLSAELRRQILVHKPELLGLLAQREEREGKESSPPSPPSPPSPGLPGAPPWDQTEADALIAGVQARRPQIFGDAGWPEVADTCERLGLLMDRVDECWLARDLPGLRRTAEALQTGLASVAEGCGGTGATEEAMCRDLERELGLPPGSVELGDPHRCSAWCRCRIGND